jgi:hypothetical protein
MVIFEKWNCGEKLLDNLSLGLNVIQRRILEASAALGIRTPRHPEEPEAT